MEHDRSLVDLGLPPAFEPFLEAGRLAAGTWEEAAERHLRAARGQRDQVLAALARDPMGSATFLAHDPERPGEAELIRLRGSEAGRDRLRDLLPAGREALRAYLLAARRALDQVGPPDQARRARRAVSAFEEVSILFLGSMISASRDRLFGSPPRSAAAMAFEADVLKHMRILRGRCLVPDGSLVAIEIAMRRDAVEAARHALEPAFLRGQVVDLLLRLDAEGEFEELRELYGRFRRDLVDLGRLDRSKLQELVRRRELPEGP
jgi:hypothetical protein